MLRERHAALAPRLARHGVHILREVLDDPSRTLISSPRVAEARRAGHAMQRLESVLDELEHALAAWSPQPPKRPGKTHSSAAVMVR